MVGLKQFTLWNDHISISELSSGRRSGILVYLSYWSVFQKTYLYLYPFVWYELMGFACSVNIYEPWYCYISSHCVRAGRIPSGPRNSKGYIVLKLKLIKLRWAIHYIDTKSFTPSATNIYLKITVFIDLGKTTRIRHYIHPIFIISTYWVKKVVSKTPKSQNSAINFPYSVVFNIFFISNHRAFVKKNFNAMLDTNFTRIKNTLFW